MALSRTKRRPLRFGFTAATALVVLGLVPFVALIVIGWGSVRDAANREAASVQIDDRRIQLRHLLGARSGLGDEQKWQTVFDAIEHVGLTTELATVATGIDLNAGMESAQEQVENNLDRLGLDELVANVREARSLGSVRRDQSFAEIELNLSTRIEELFVDLGQLGTRLGDNGEASNLVEATEAAASASGAVGEQIATYISSLLEPASPNSSGVALLTAMDRVDRSVARIGRHLSTDAAQHESVSAVQVALVDYRQLVLDRADNLVGNNSPADPPSIPDLLAAAAAIQEHQATATTVLERLAVVERNIASELRQSTATVRTTARSEKQQLVLLLTSLAVLGLVANYVVQRMIARPLARLEQAATMFSRGETEASFDVGGTREIHATGTALEAAVQRLRLAVRQAKALTEGDLSDEAFAVENNSVDHELDTAVQSLRNAIGRREELEAELSHAATHDPLTGLANRAAVMAHLDARVGALSACSQGIVAVLFVDLDGFKAVNDQHGHLVGDQTLVAVARRLDHAVGQDALVGRLGGDEFVIVQSTTAPDRLATLARDVCDSVAHPIALSDVTVTIGASVGVSICSDSSCEPSSLLAQADQALYQAKSQGKSRAVFYADEASFPATSGSPKSARVLQD